MSKDKPIVLAPVETRIANVEREIVQIEGLQDLKSLELAAVDFLLQSKQTYLIRLQAEKALNEAELKARL